MVVGQCLIPSFMGRVRARATCVSDGGTKSGESEFFTVNSNSVVRVGKIEFEEIDISISNEISFQATEQILDLNLDEDSNRTFLRINATFSDGTVENYINLSLHYSSRGHFFGKFPAAMRD